MKTKQVKNERVYESPQTQVLAIEPGSVLCQSGKDSITGNNTGVFWEEGEESLFLGYLTAEEQSQIYPNMEDRPR